MKIMKRFSRNEIVDRLNNRIRKYEPIVVCGAGTGLYARAAEREKVDFLIASAKSDALVNGLGAQEAVLPYHDANHTSGALAKHLLPVLKDTPVVAGIAAYNPYIDIRRVLKQMKQQGFSGITNSPGGSIYEGPRKKVCMAQEAEMILAAKEMDIFTMAFVTSEEEIKAMVLADVIVTQCREDIRQAKVIIDYQEYLSEQVFAENKNTILLADVGNLTEAEAVQELMFRTKALGIVSEEAVESLLVHEKLTTAFEEILNL